MKIKCGENALFLQFFVWFFSLFISRNFLINFRFIFFLILGSTELMGSCMILDKTLKIHKGEVTAPSLAIDISCVDDAG